MLFQINAMRVSCHSIRNLLYFAQSQSHENMTAKRLFLILDFALLSVLSQNALVVAQGTAGEKASIESRAVIDIPTAGVLSHGTTALDLDFFQSGGLLTGVTVGVFSRLIVGLSYGGTGLIGSDHIDWNGMPGVLARIRVLDESFILPALAFGFESQGREKYVESLRRYTIKSLGLYAVASKNYRVSGFLAVHGGVNYSFEQDDGDSDINLFAGAEKTLGSFLSVLAEYNLGMNDSNRDALGRGRGYLNIGVKASLGGGLMLGFNLKDIIKNQDAVAIGNRTIRLEYVNHP